MKHEFSFGKINILSDNIAEIIINQDVELSIEMVEEFEHFFTEQFLGGFGLLVNKINRYQYTYEAMLTIGSHENLNAIAVVNYHPKDVIKSEQIAKLRESDNLNLKSFSGLEMGCQDGLDWLNAELSVNKELSE